MDERLSVEEHVPLAQFTTLGVGGPARYYVLAEDPQTVEAAVAWAAERRIPLFVLGGGSNVVMSDEGFAGLVVHVAIRGVVFRSAEGGARIHAAAGEPWDEVVAGAVERGWAGVECLSGIPGYVGATPIQNVGAYGQEVSDTVVAVRALDTQSGEIATLPAARCGFAYRDSVFKRSEPGRWVVLAVTYRLRPGGPPTLGYADVAGQLARQAVAAPTLADVRAAVLTVRRGKSMVLDDPADPNRHSCGSFFLNPVLDAAAAGAVAERAGDPSMPRWPQGTGRVKLSAAWLIEHAGFTRGERAGPVGLSSRHTLAIVAHDGARARDVRAFARRVQDTVEARFGVRLTPEPVFWGDD